MTDPHREGDQPGWQAHVDAPAVPEADEPKLKPVGFAARLLTYGFAILIIIGNLVDHVPALWAGDLTFKKAIDALFVIALFIIVVRALFRPSESARGRWNKWGWLLIATVVLSVVIYVVSEIRGRFS